MIGCNKRFITQSIKIFMFFFFVCVKTLIFKILYLKHSFSSCDPLNVLLCGRGFKFSKWMLHCVKFYVLVFHYFKFKLYGLHKSFTNQPKKQKDFCFERNESLTKEQQTFNYEPIGQQYLSLHLKSFTILQSSHVGNEDKDNVDKENASQTI